MSVYKYLNYVVEVDDTFRPGFEPIAAFNSEHVAKKYARDCALSNRGRTYRVKFVEVFDYTDETIIDSAYNKAA